MEIAKENNFISSVIYLSDDELLRPECVRVFLDVWKKSSGNMKLL